LEENILKDLVEEEHFKLIVEKIIAQELAQT
jgi:hypothetical protein